MRDCSENLRKFKSTMYTDHVLPNLEVGQLEHLDHPLEKYDFISEEEWDEFLVQRLDLEWVVINNSIWLLLIIYVKWCVDNYFLYMCRFFIKSYLCWGKKNIIIPYLLNNMLGWSMKMKVSRLIILILVCVY